MVPARVTNQSSSNILSFVLLFSIAAVGVVMFTAPTESATMEYKETAPEMSSRLQSFTSAICTLDIQNNVKGILAIPCTDTDAEQLEEMYTAKQLVYIVKAADFERIVQTMEQLGR